MSNAMKETASKGVTVKPDFPKTYLITTKFFGPTSTRGPRIKVESPFGVQMISYPYGVNDAHGTAALEYLMRLGKSGELKAMRGPEKTHKTGELYAFTEAE